VAGCKKQAAALRNETDHTARSRGTLLLENTIDTINSPPGCPAKFKILANTGVCMSKTHAEEKLVANISACCDWCNADPHCIGWTYHHSPSNHQGLFACFKCNETSGGHTENRTSGCVGDACNLDGHATTDLYANDGPATIQKRRGSPEQCYQINESYPWPANSSGCVYEDQLFEEEVTRIVTAHDPR
jgi:hypothetical protein